MLVRLMPYFVASCSARIQEGRRGVMPVRGGVSGCEWVGVRRAGHIRTDPPFAPPGKNTVSPSPRSQGVAGGRCLSCEFSLPRGGVAPCLQMKNDVETFWVVVVGDRGGVRMKKPGTRNNQVDRVWYGSLLGLCFPDVSTSVFGSKAW